MKAHEASRREEKREQGGHQGTDEGMGEHDDSDDEDDADAKTDSRSHHLIDTVKSYNPMAIYLGPVQKGLGDVLQCLRCIEHILDWRDSFFSFWCTSGLVILLVVTLVFPFALVFFRCFQLAGFLVFGPQNFLLGCYNNYGAEVVENNDTAEADDDAADNKLVG